MAGQAGTEQCTEQKASQGYVECRTEQRSDRQRKDILWQSHTVTLFATFSSLFLLLVRMGPYSIYKALIQTFWGLPSKVQSCAAKLGRSQYISPRPSGALGRLRPLALMGVGVGLYGHPLLTQELRGIERRREALDCSQWEYWKAFRSCFAQVNIVVTRGHQR